jgi:hypothetical protein
MFCEVVQGGTKLGVVNEPESRAVFTALVGAPQHFAPRLGTTLLPLAPAPHQIIKLTMRECHPLYISTPRSFTKVST